MVVVRGMDFAEIHQTAECEVLELLMMATVEAAVAVAELVYLWLVLWVLLPVLLKCK